MEAKVQRHYSFFWGGFFAGVTLKSGISFLTHIIVRYFLFDSQLSLTSAMLKVKSFVAYSHKHMTLFVWALTIIISVHCWHAHVIVLVSTLPTYIMHSLNRSLYVLVQCYWCQAGFLDLARYGGDAVKLHAHVTGNKGNSGNATMQCIHCTIMVIALAKRGNRVDQYSMYTA